MTVLENAPQTPSSTASVTVQAKTLRAVRKTSVKTIASPAA